MKQRLVGTLVLGCLALIFIPLLLDGDGLSPARINSQIPQQPDIDMRRPAEPQRPVLSTVVNTPTASTTPSRASDIAIPDAVISTNESLTSDTQPVMTPQGLPEAWSVRLGIFGERKNAETLLNRLLKSGYKAYSRPVSNAQRELTAVFVGPVLSKAEAELLLKELDQKFEIKGIVSKFSVAEQE